MIFWRPDPAPAHHGDRYEVSAELSRLAHREVVRHLGARYGGERVNWPAKRSDCLYGLISMDADVCVRVWAVELAQKIAAATRGLVCNLETCVAAKPDGLDAEYLWFGVQWAGNSAVPMPDV